VIVLDTSAILAVISGEPEAELFAKLMSDHDCLLGTPTRLEAAIVVRGRSNDAQLRQLQGLLNARNVETAAFGPDHVAQAELAFEKYGKGQGHPARLNFGDCMAYAVARVASVPLLFKGNDFAHTDIVPAWIP
jgi:ribonuclease VapC